MKNTDPVLNNKFKISVECKLRHHDDASTVHGTPHKYSQAVDMCQRLEQYCGLFQQA